MKFDKATLRERFHVAQSEKAAVEAAVQPLIDQREALIAEMRPMQERLDALNEQLKDAVSRSMSCPLKSAPLPGSCAIQMAKHGSS